MHDGQRAVLGPAAVVIDPVGCGGVGAFVGEWEVLVEVVVSAAEVEGLGRRLVGRLG